jgi:hypothetical protein
LIVIQLIHLLIFGARTDETVVCLARNFHLFGCDFAKDADGNARAGELFKVN